ncbi:MAG: queuine tRNA-ribosyltransferase [archaeon GW2011_AR3]|nr:MAG: queuine tRNA-ribosyltransferase [archaeon GW2011_AR3]
MGYLKFSLKSGDAKSSARTGLLKLKHGTIRTPELIPVATKATVKALSSDDLKGLGAQALICNTYHLMLKPGPAIVEKMGGLHKFMNWGRPLLTDSGGFQAFSLGLGIEHATGKMSLYFPEDNKGSRKPGKSTTYISDKGISFRSVYDNSRHFLTPASSIRIQEQLGADMILALDECTSPMSGREYTAKSLARTHRWAKESLDAHVTGQAIAGIVQGGHWKDLRKKSAKYIASLGFDSLAIGGSLGKSKNDMHKILEWTVPLLPESKPRHLLGIGVVEDIFEAVERGIDLFDCVGPTRQARAGYIYARPPLGNVQNKFKFKITAGKFAADPGPLDPNCQCRVCMNHSRAYVCHLFNSDELLAYSLASYHNVHFFMALMKDIRQSIQEKRFQRLKKEWGIL